MSHVDRVGASRAVANRVDRLPQHIALCLMAGIVLGAQVGGLVWWLAIALVAVAVMVVMWRRRRGGAVRCWALVAVAALGASWFILRHEYTHADTVRKYLTDEPQLARVTGRVSDGPWLSSPQLGPFAAYSYLPPATFVRLELHTIEVGGEAVAVHGGLLMKLPLADPSLAVGQEVEATGWLAAIAGPNNPGEFDFRRLFADRGIAGRLTLRTRGNWKLLRESPAMSRLRLAGVREEVADAAVSSLRLGLMEHGEALALLQTLLLGQRGELPDELEHSFRRVGLAHLLSISGAHLGILLGLVWLAARLFVPHPPRVALIVLAVLVLYLFAVPWRVPIMRASIMAGTFALAYAAGRRPDPAQLLSLAAVIVLVWRPGDLFSPGFQLSFTAVWAILRYTLPVSNWLWPRAELEVQDYSAGTVVLRWLVDYCAVSLVAFAAVLPLVAYHFQMVNPLAVLLSIMSLPVLTAVLAVGYIKIVVGILLPSASIILSGPLLWLTQTLMGLVEHASDWPGATIQLTYKPSLVWVAMAVAFVLALLGGRFARRPVALVTCAALVVGWTVYAQHPAAHRPRGTALRLNMFAVGDGSCFLLRTGTHTLMFDCGSQAYLDVGQASIVPALRALGVRRIDTLMLSHADLDHYVGVLDVIAQFPVGRILVTPNMIAETQDSPAGPTAFLFDQLKLQGHAPQPITRGWRERLGGAAFEALWPPGDYRPQRANDSSLVLSVRAADRRILLCGDIQSEAIGLLLGSGGDLRADVMDLPHHGSFVENSPAFLAATGPSMVLQSSGPARLRQDRWAPLLSRQGVGRYVTAEAGMVELRVVRVGGLEVLTYRMGRE